MKKIVFIFLLFISLFNITYWSYQSQLIEINWMISWYQTDISKYQSEKDAMIFKYNWYINDLKNEKETALQKLAWANNKMWVWNSSYAINSYNNLSNEYDNKIQSLENEKNYNASIYDKLIATTKQSISEWEKIKVKIEKSIEIDNIYNEITSNIDNKNYDKALSLCEKWYNIALEYNLDFFLDYYKKIVPILKEYKNEDFKKENANKEKEILNSANEYFNKWSNYYKNRDYDNAILNLNKAISILENNKNINWASEIISLCKEYISTINKLKDDLSKLALEEKKQKEIDYENKLKDKANIAFNKIKSIINKKPASKQLDIYKWLLTQLETYKNKLSNDKLIILNELIRLFQNEVNNWWDEIWNILNDLLK